MLNKAVILPNFLTGVRIIATPVISYLIIHNQLPLAFYLFIFAGLTDWLDGLTARYYHVTSQWGRLFDPLADKILVIGIYITLAYTKHFPQWLSIVVISRDVLILLGALIVWLFNIPHTLKPIFISKINTFFQLLLCLSVLGKTFMAESSLYTLYLNFIFYGTLVTTIVSGIIYAKIFFKSYSR